MTLGKREGKEDIIHFEFTLLISSTAFVFHIISNLSLQVNKCFSDTYLEFDIFILKGLHIKSTMEMIPKAQEINCHAFKSKNQH
jgi:hypothetical protein